MAAAPGSPDMVVPTHRRRRPGEFAPPAGRSRWRLSNWRVRTKLTAALVIPALAFLVMAGAQAASLVAASTAATDYARRMELAPRLASLVHQLQAERDRTLGELTARTARGGPSPDTSQIDKALAPFRAGTDRELADFTAALRQLPRGTETWAAARDRVTRALDALAGLRELAVVAALPARVVFESYRWTIETLIDLMAQSSTGSAPADTTARVTALVQLAKAKEISSQLRARLFGAANAGVLGASDLVELTDLRADRTAALGDFRASANAEQLRRFDSVTSTAAFGRADQLADDAISRAGGGTVGLDVAQWWTVSTAQQEQLRQVEAGLLTEAVAAARSYRDTRLRRTLLAAGAIAAVLVVALLTSYAIGRSMHRSLRLLRAQALQVAQLQLPDVIRRLRALKPTDHPEISMPSTHPRSLDEIGEVAEAFAAVHRSAVELAVEQAVMRRHVNAMFVNLARRSQVLVERQLELLDELEREEGDPDQLENLFKLDHLAARMRRNDENLLVLAGSDTIRRWSEPVELPEVTLAAIAEIEQYPRVRHEVAQHLFVVGHVVSDLVHLLAELLENATSFSAPETPVLITGGPHARGTALIEITDQGMGMNEAALAEANHLLASPPMVDVAASERMGLFVVSHIAARHGVRVQLSADERGLVASVWLPGTLLAPAPVRALPGPRDARPMIAAVAAGSVPAGPSAGAATASGAAGRAVDGYSAGSPRDGDA
ncbi:MAG TPA: nitrate- and nitrite sensing domain-containing protein, partial [Micromonosporaceae bacterium]|nr:nitrate- and nitrite sensing domain-containing protein [Micromonosporaceae bacterium]